jgi:ribosomal-protein-alanine N-acetyltransferase
LVSKDTISLVFSELTAADVDAVVDIENQSFETPWSRNLFLRELSTAISRSTLARAGEHADRLLGYVCRWLVLDEIQILNLAVHPNHRRCGVGRALVQGVIDEAYEQRVRTVSLEVRDGNESALRLYESFGFERTGIRRNYYGNGRDGVLMSLGLKLERT